MNPPNALHLDYIAVQIANTFDIETVFRQRQNNAQVELDRKMLEREQQRRQRAAAAASKV